MPEIVQSWKPATPSAQPSHTPRLITFQAYGRLSRFFQTIAAMSRKCLGLVWPKPKGTAAFSLAFQPFWSLWEGIQIGSAVHPAFNIPALKWTYHLSLAKETDQKKEPKTGG